MASSNNYYLYIIVNSSLKMSKGKVAAQVGHVVMDVVEYLLSNNIGLYNKYKYQGGAKIVLQADQNMLLKLSHKSGKSFCVFDAGLTEVAEGSLTCMTFLPMTKKHQAEHYPEIKSFKLL